MGIIGYIKQSGLVHFWLWCVLIISALIVVAMQLCCFLVLWPLSKRLHRDVNGMLIQLFWFQYVWLADHWSGSQLYIHCKDEDVPFVGSDNSLFVLNHRSDVDWIVVWQMAARFNLLPGGKACMKDELKYVPIIGWSFYLSEQIFVKRNYAEDKESLLKQLENVTTYHVPTTTILFCEGTRYTKEKYELSQEFAKKRGIPGLRHHLIPRTKGFALCVQAYKERDMKIYDGTIAYAGGHVPTLYDLMCGKKYDCHLYQRRFPVDDVPCETEEASSQFCHEMYRGKDEAFDYFLKHDTFEGFDSERTIHEFPRPRLTLYIMRAWMLIVTLPLIYYIYTVVTSGSILKLLLSAAVIYSITYFSQFMMSVSKAGKGSSYGKEDKKK